MHRVVVTGAAGFIGSNLTRKLLAEGYDVIALDNLSAGTRENLPPSAPFFHVDICRENLDDFFKGASTVFHLAAKNCLPDCANHPVTTFEVNVVGTARVAEACVRQGVEHLVYSDTSAEYEGVELFPTPVESVAPMSVYACSKRGGYLAAEALSRLHPRLTLSTVRYFNVYGPAQDWRRVVPPVMSAFTLKLLRSERPVIYGSGEKRRDFIHVDDVNRFHLMLIEDRAIQGRVYNLGSGSDASIGEVYELIEGEIRSGLSPEYAPDLPAEAFRTLADITATMRTGWKPEVGLRDGVRAFIDYMRTRLAMG